MSARINLVPTPDTERLIKAMSRPSMPADVERYMAGVLQAVGVRAQARARAIIGNQSGYYGAALAPATEISSLLRKSPTHRGSSAPLLDTGKMRAGIRYSFNRSGRFVTLGVVGERASVAMMHEAGYVFHISRSMFGKFLYNAKGAGADAARATRRKDTRAMSHGVAEGLWYQMAGSAWRRDGDPVSVPPRPFLSVALREAFDWVTSEAMGGQIAGQVFNLWTSPAGGGTTGGVIAARLVPRAK